MERRELLRWTGAVGALAAAGCVGDNGSGPSGSSDDTPTPSEDESTNDSGNTDTPTDTPEADSSSENGESSSPESSPAETVEAFFEAFGDGEVEAVNELVHADGEVGSLSQEDLPSDRDGSLSVERLLTVEEGPEEAVVELLVGAEESPMERGVSAVRMELRTTDDEWKVWSWGSPVEEIAPVARFDTATTDGTLEITHVEGDQIPADELSVRGEGLGATGSWQELGGTTTDDGTVTAGNTLAVGIDDEYSISLVWDDGEVTMSFFGASGSSATEAAEGNDDPCTDEELPTTDAPDAVEEYLADADAYAGLVDWRGRSEVTVRVGGCENGFSFVPAGVQIDPGTTVTWEWTGLGGAHNLVAESGEFETDIYAEEETTFEYSFEESGTWLYYCAPHRALGMKGAVVVEE